MQLDPIAITGVSVLFPGSPDSAGFWRDILAGKDLITDVPASYWAIADYFDSDPSAADRTYSRRGGFIPEMPFDPLANGLPPNVLPATDNAQLLGLMVAERVLQDALANRRFPHVDRERISVILGATGTTELISHMSGRTERPRWEAALRASGLDEEQVKRLADRIADQFTPWQENTFPGFLGNVIAGRIASRLNLGGTNCVVDAACASSLAAVRCAVQELASGSSDLVLTGGVDALNVPLMYMAFSKTGALSRSGDCRPYSDKADGTILGDGVGMMALRRLADAERDGDRIYAVLRGLGSSSDGRAKSIYAPVAEGQALAVRRAYESAGISPATVELIEGHGTGTTAGDKAEVAGLSQAFDALTASANEGDSRGRQWCALGSIKSQIGHTKGAAGIAGMFKAVMALHHKVLPPTIKVDQPNPVFDIANTPFYLNTRLRPWVRDDRHPRRAGVSSAGFGGTNFHVVLEEYTGPSAKPCKVRPASTELILAAAEDSLGLAIRCEQLLQECVQAGPGPEGLQRVARRSQEQFTVGSPARLAVVASSLEDLQSKLRRAAETLRAKPDCEQNDPSGVYFAVGKQAGEVAFLFPGQGSQYVGMGQDLALFFDEARAVWDQAAELKFDGGQRLHETVFPAPVFSAEEEQKQEARLTRTEWAQPALAACSMAGVAVLRRLGLEPAFVAGHSFGELSALCAAGTFGLLDLIRTARRRGELMAAASAVPGAMTAVRASSEQVEKILGNNHPDVLIANRNSPRQVVLSGPTARIAAAEAALTAASLSFKRLPVATAFHSPLVSSSMDPFRQFLQSVPMLPPCTVVYANSTAKPYPREASDARDLLARQLASSVRFEEMVKNLARRGVRTFLEVGAGSVLTGLVGECLAEQPHLAVALDRKGQSGLTSLWHALGRLAVQGVSLNWASLWQDHADVPAPKAPPGHTVMVGGASKGRRLDNTRETASPPRPASTPRSQPAVPSPIVPTKPVSPRLQPTVTASPMVSNGVPTLPVRVTPEPGPSRSKQESPTMTKKLNAVAAVNKHTLNGDGPGLGVRTHPPTGLVDAVQVLMGEAAKAQETFQKLMAQSCQRYFESVERSVQVLAGLGQQSPTNRLPDQIPVHLPSPSPSQASEPVQLDLLRNGSSWFQPSEATSRLLPTARFSASTVPHQNGNRISSEPAADTMAASEAVAFVADVSAPGQETDLEGAVLKVVAEKTGYPAELLNMDMDIEADLGIDSIKRVEILAALEAAFPALAGADRCKMTALRTLGDFRDILRPAVPPVEVAASPAREIISDQVPTPGQDTNLEEAVLQVVAEKTGYPAELLNMDMDVEADLGIDSIKRVEILAALESTFPALAGVDRCKMTNLRTLGDFRDILRPTSGPAAPHSPQERPELVKKDSAPVSTVPLDSFPRQVVRVTEAPAPGFALSGLREASPLVILISAQRVNEDENQVARTLAAGLREQGLEVEVSSEVTPNARGVIFLGGLRPIAKAEEAIEIQREAFNAARQFARRAEQGGAFVIVQDTGGDFGMSGCGVRAWLGGLPGLVKTAMHEWPAASLKAIDLESAGRPPETLASVLLMELLAGGLETEVGLRADGSRVTLRCEQVSTSSPGEAASFVRDGDVIVVSGGARGVTASCVLELARRNRLRLVLLGRTPLGVEPPGCGTARSESELVQALLQGARQAGGTIRLEDARTRSRQILQQREIEENLAALRKTGAEIRYLPVDVRDRSALSAGLAQVRQDWGPITGLIHGAGVLADRLIKDKTLEHFDQVFSVKVDGLRSLLEATKSDPLRLLCLFSSVAARVGNSGQSDYSMANEILNKVAAAEQARRGKGCLVKAINWGAWEGGMVTPVLKERFQARGVRLLPLEEGSRQFADELTSGAQGVEVVLGVADFTDPLKLSRDAATTFDIVVEPERWAFLRSHCVEEGVPVVPMVLVLEWFVRAGRVIWPGQKVSCRDLKVLAGVQLRDFERGHWFRIVCRPMAANVVEVELHGDKVRHYSAVLAPAPQGVRSQKKPRSPKDKSREIRPRSARSAYEDGLLFHGPHFQVLRTLDDLSGKESGAELHGTDEVGWGAGPWLTDPASLDGGLQLALLWTLHHTDRKSLPTRFEEFVPLGSPGARARRCDLQVRQSGRHETVADLLFSEANGRPVAELRGVTMTLFLNGKHKVAS